MNINRNTLPLFAMAMLLLLGWDTLAKAQEYKVVRDLHLWTGIKIEKEFGKDWTLFVAEEVRFKHDISSLNNYLTETGLRYRINKNFALEGQYRITRDQKKDNSFETLTRYALDLRYKGKVDFLTLMYRLRYQKEVSGWNLADPGIPYEKYVRNRLTVRYNDLMYLKPYVSAEVFQLFEPNQPGRFHYIRVMGGIRYRVPRIGEFNLAYGFNREFKSPNPAMIYVVKVNYTYTF
jgi:hypothetical protein